MHSAVKDLIRMGDALFGQKSTVDSLWQELALNFYPERADFTSKRNEGEEYSDHLFSSYPVLARRELGNLFSASLRPQSQKWFSIHVDNKDVDKGDEEREFLEFLSEIQWRAMYDRPAKLVKATKQTDHDYAAFGNGAIHVGPNNDLSGLLYRNYHLRDCAWSENASETVDVFHRNWTPTARQLVSDFPGKVAPEVEKAATKDPEKKFKCRHVVVPERVYGENKRANGGRFEYTSMFIDMEHERILEQTGLDYFSYVVPRWQTVSGSAYGRSMATAVALPDGRTMQVVMRTLREAGEKYVDPPMIAIADAIRGDIPTYAGGITVADMEYDERLGDVLRPITQNSGGMPIGFEIAQALREDVRNAFFLDKIQLPQAGTDMTAFEVRRRIEEHIRAASPIFEPIEQEYNGPLCEVTFNVLQKFGAFPMDQMPESLQGNDINFSFRSPLSDMADQNEAAIFQEGLQTVLAPAAQIDPAQLANVDMTKGTRDALRAVGFKAEWLAPEEAVQEARQQQQEQAMAERAMQEAQQAGVVGEQAGKAAQALEGLV